MKIMLTLITTMLIFSGCDSTTTKRQNTEGIENVKTVAGRYLHYTIENGTVQCREHLSRSELTCWNIKD